MREASKSLVPLLMWGFGSVGPCHQSSLSVPPPPRLVGLKAAAVALAPPPAGAEPAPVAAAEAAAAWVAAPPFVLFDAVLLLDPQAASTLAITGMVRPAANIFAMKCRREIRPALNCSARSATVQSAIGWHLLRSTPPHRIGGASLVCPEKRVKRTVWRSDADAATHACVTIPWRAEHTVHDC